MKCAGVLGAAAVALMLVAGCEEPANGPASDPAQQTGSPAGGAPASQPVSLEVASWEDVQKHVAAQKGKVVVLDLWSTSCQPCIKELPGLAKLHQQHGADVACLTMNMDYIGLKDEPPETYREAAAKILADKGVQCQNFLSSTPDEEIYKQLGAAAVPIVLVYDRDGKLAKRFDNDTNEYGDEGFTYQDHVAPLVKDLVAGQSAAKDNETTPGAKAGENEAAN